MNAPHDRGGLLGSLLQARLNKRKPMARTRLPYCSPYRLISALLPGRESPADRIHRAYAGFVWRSACLRHIALIGVMATAWPLAFVVMAIMFTRSIGPAVAAATGKGIARQLWEQWWLAAIHSIPPDKYYVFELFRDERRRYARDYVMRFELKGAFHNLMRQRAKAEQRDGRARASLANKQAFGRTCHEAGVDVPAILAWVDVDKARSKWRLVPQRGSQPGLPKRDIFIKPARGKGGRGCEKWIYTGRFYKGSDGWLLSEAELLAHIGKLTRQRGRYLIQECLENHRDLAGLSGGLNTLRITSCRNEYGGFEVTNATLKFSFSNAASVDNFHQGGGIARVDIQSGIVGPASDSWSRRPCLWHAHHPVTGARIEGLRLPLWKETVAAVERTHNLFADRVMLGFDVAITDRGPVIIEGNVQSGCDMIQRTHDLPIGAQRLGELLAYHADEAMRRPLPHMPMEWCGPLHYLGRR